MSTTTDDRVGLDNVGSVPCRRRRARQGLISVVLYVDFGADNGGIVLNLNEDGFSVQTAMPLAVDSLSSMRFKGGRNRDSLEVGGRLVWMSSNRKAAGIEFVDLSEDARRRITEWIALEASPQRDNHPPPDEALQTTKSVPSVPERDRFPEQPLVIAETQEDRNSVHRGKLLHLVPVGASASSDPSTAVDDFDALLRAQWSASKAPAPTEPQAGIFRPLVATASPPHSNAVISAIFLIAMLTLAAGLGFGYVMLGGGSNRAAKPPVQPSALPASSSASPSTAVDRDAAPIAQQPAGLSPGSASGNDLQNPAAQSQDSQSKPATPPASATLPGSQTSLTVSKVSQLNSFAPANPDPAERAAATEQDADTPRLRPVESPGPVQAQTIQTQPVQARPAQTQTPQISTQPARPDGAPPNESADSASVLAAARASGVPAPAALPAIVTDASEAHPSASRPEEPRVLAPPSPAHIEACRLIQSVEPVYPLEAKQRRIEGNVELRVVVGTDGTVRSVSLVSGLPLLAPAAIAAAHGFRYSPALLNGQPIETIQTIEMSFKLKH
jgi:periplasmic protein TonB